MRQSGLGFLNFLESRLPALGDSDTISNAENFQQHLSLGHLYFLILGFDLLNKLIMYDPDQRITAEEALNHPWFREVPLPKSKEFMPTFPAQHAQDRKELQQGEFGTGG